MALDITGASIGVDVSGMMGVAKAIQVDLIEKSKDTVNSDVEALKDNIPNYWKGASAGAFATKCEIERARVEAILRVLEIKLLKDLGTMAANTGIADSEVAVQILFGEKPSWNGLGSSGGYTGSTINSITNGGGSTGGTTTTTYSSGDQTSSRVPISGTPGTFPTPEQINQEANTINVDGTDNDVQNLEQDGNQSAWLDHMHQAPQDDASSTQNLEQDGNQSAWLDHMHQAPQDDSNDGLIKRQTDKIFKELNVQSVSEEDIKNGTPVDLSSIEYGRSNAYTDQLKKLLTEAGVDVSFLREVTNNNGEVMWAFNQSNGLGYAWFPRDEVLDILNKNTTPSTTTTTTTTTTPNTTTYTSTNGQTMYTNMQ